MASKTHRYTSPVFPSLNLNSAFVAAQLRPGVQPSNHRRKVVSVDVRSKTSDPQSISTLLEQSLLDLVLETNI